MDIRQMQYILALAEHRNFTDRGSVVEVFDDPTVWQGIFKVIESINKNAIA